MTRLSERKSRLAFASDEERRYRGRMRVVVIEAEEKNGFTATVRLAGTRMRYPFGWGEVFDHAAERYAGQERERGRKERAHARTNQRN